MIGEGEGVEPPPRRCVWGGWSRAGDILLNEDLQKYIIEENDKIIKKGDNNNIINRDKEKRDKYIFNNLLYLKKLIIIFLELLLNISNTKLNLLIMI